MSDLASSYRQALLNPRFSVERFDREVLLSHVTGQNRAWIWSHLDDRMPPEQLADFTELLTLRENGHPIAYLLGFREFYGRDFQVSPAVLIPRPETELLVELALSLLPRHRARVIDVGTGSGAIALTLAAERPDWRILASDLSKPALGIACANRARLGLENVDLIQCDLLAGISERSFDLIISNPPYVAEGDPHLQAGDLRFEPALALSCGADGLSVIRQLVAQAARSLEPGGRILLEHGHDQAASVRDLLCAHGFDSVRSWPDLAGIERVSGGVMPTRVAAGSDGLALPVCKLK
jgi:release factor glutamine methyltransferase